MNKTSIGLIGYGSVGQYLAHAVLTDESMKEQYTLSFIWNRTKDKILQDEIVMDNEVVILDDLTQFDKENPPDVIVEVAHPVITQEFAPLFLEYADYYIGSPTALANRVLEETLRDAAEGNEGGHGVYVPVGALWGGQDIQKMGDSGKLDRVTITMKKHPGSFKLLGSLKEKLDEVAELEGEQVLFDGPVRDLCPMAPLNTNTMACAAIAGVGFDDTRGILISDTSLRAHIIEITVEGPQNLDGERFSVTSRRYNPASTGAVTGSATYLSFLNSLKRVGNKGNGIHLC
eukprot:TRINITY_DN13103_c0_g1_i1.p1 TRINITY_DN13103_c0_g1~~TRINITY_DN13103_c0_g1_i1.p1  ORF type:complete len:288 (+),score=71.69 TRINITY_DN13103_c0_g1_i1:60-923(+)